MVEIYHPMFVHFPIALLSVTAIIGLIDVFQKKYDLKNVIKWNLIFAALGSLVAVITGFRDAGVIPHNLTIHLIMEQHEHIGVAVLVLSVLLSAWIILRSSKMKKAEHLIFVLMLWAGLVLVSYNGYLGGKMVFDNGAGIKPMQKTFLLEDHDHD